MSKFEGSLLILALSLALVYSTEPSCSLSNGILSAFAQIGIRPTSVYLQQTNRLVQVRDDSSSEDDSTDESDTDTDSDSESDSETDSDADTTITFEEYTLATEYTMTDDDFTLTGGFVYTYDTDGDASLDSDEFETAMASLGYNSYFADMCMNMVDGWMGH